MTERDTDLPGATVEAIAAVDELLEVLAARGVSSADFYPDGKLSGVVFFGRFTVPMGDTGGDEPGHAVNSPEDAVSQAALALSGRGKRPPVKEED